tara:strand:+ start:8201 stop:8500 length:300 start_codon:yes stop_codon:yes gene_type:complete
MNQKQLIDYNALTSKAQRSRAKSKRATCYKPEGYVEYDKENDKIVSAVGSDIEIFPLGETFARSSKIEVAVGDALVIVPVDQIRELVDGLSNAATRVGL